jgi:hypothetical protein
MRSLALVPWILAGACASSPASPPAEPVTRAASPWETPPGFRGETIPFPLDFAPEIVHKGVEELRFAPGFFDPKAPGYFAYAFVWRTEDPAEMDAAGLGAELVTYFRGLIHAVDASVDLADPDAVVVRATADGARFSLAAHVFDAFKAKQPLDLVGWAQRTPCEAGALWRFTLAPAGFTGRSRLNALASQAACGQPVPPPPPPRP